VSPGREPARVVLIGPESTGKTWLAGDLARHFGVPWSPEYAREYVAGLDRPLSFADVDAIGRGQRAVEDSTVERARAEGARLVVLDTDLVSTMVYSRHYYGDCPEWIPPAARGRAGALYLLHHIDVEWVADGFQREQPERREDLFAAFRDALRELGASTVDVAGDWEERKRRALHTVSALSREIEAREGGRSG